MPFPTYVMLGSSTSIFTTAYWRASPFTSADVTVHLLLSAEPVTSREISVMGWPLSIVFSPVTELISRKLDPT